MCNVPRAMIGVVLTLALLIAGLWLWEQTRHWAVDAARPNAVIWAGRLSAVAVVSAGQAALFGLVIAGVYGVAPRRAQAAWTALGLATLSLAGAATAGLFGVA